MVMFLSLILLDVIFLLLLVHRVQHGLHMIELTLIVEILQLISIKTLAKRECSLPTHGKFGSEVIKTTSYLHIVVNDFGLATQLGAAHELVKAALLEDLAELFERAATLTHILALIPSIIKVVVLLGRHHEPLVNFFLTIARREQDSWAFKQLDVT